MSSFTRNLPAFVQTNWSQFLNTKPSSIAYWIALLVLVLSVVRPRSVYPLADVTTMSVDQVRLVAGVIVATMYSSIQLRMF
jgi:hypothetical protein